MYLYSIALKKSKSISNDKKFKAKYNILKNFFV